MPHPFPRALGLVAVMLIACGGTEGPGGEADTASPTTPAGSTPAGTAGGTTPTGTSGGTTPTGTTPAGTATGTPGPVAADRVLRDARIYTVDPDQPWAEALAIHDGALVYVGDEAGVDAWIGPDTQVTDLDGRTVMPGLHDVHIHLLEAFHEVMVCYTPAGMSLERHVSRIRSCAPDRVGTEWVLGWGFSIFDALFAPRVPATILDDAVPDRPAAIMEETSHAAWVNSAALDALGIDRSTPDPVGGVIVREADGRPSGLLLDAAAELAFDLALVPNPTLDAMNEDALRAGVRAANAAGITSVADARAYWLRNYPEAWRAVRDRGELTLRSVVGLWAYPDADDDDQIAALAAMYADDPEGMLRFTQVKLYDDGLLQNTTAALLEPYVSPFTLAGPTGLTYFDRDRLTRYATELEAVGFDLHVHAIGDRGVREALDAIAAARAANGDLGARHRLTHVEWVHPDDVPRFAALAVTADLQMSYKWVEEEYLDDQAFFVGEERARERQWPLADLYASGARVTLSSDYDVGSLSPFAGMARAIDRGEQSLPDLDAAIRAYTSEAAWLLRQEDRVGTLEVGKRADLVVVDRDLFTTDALAETRVLWTLLDGDEVHVADGFTP